MNKIAMLTPCLMLETNREANLRAQNYAIEHYLKHCCFDHYVIYDQCFKEGDFLPGVEYIGHQDTRVGFIKPRNELLKWFYNSDYDYAFWMDGNKYVSGNCLNDLATLGEAIRFGDVNEDFILSTLGNNVSAHRIKYHKAPDYFDSIHLVPVDAGYLWLHGLFMRNLKKYYNEEIYIPEDWNREQGGSCEDMWFIMRARATYRTYLCPTITINCPPARTSTWMTNAKGYDYPDEPKLALAESTEKAAAGKPTHFERPIINYTFSRVDYMKDKLSEFKPRSKKQ